MAGNSAAFDAFQKGLPLETHEAFSGIFGSISLAAWIFLLVPQLVENYRQGDAEGISLLFLSIWLVGDLTNFLGAVWAGLVPTVIALAVYFCLADLVLILQCLYYNIRNARQRRVRASSAVSAQSDVEDAEEPLLSRRASDNIGLPGSRRRSSAAAHRREVLNGNDSYPAQLSDVDEESYGKIWLKNALSVFLICAVGTLGWFAAWKSGVWTPTPEDNDDSEAPIALGAQILGYSSAICYLGARIPQIIKNYRERSCEGLSLLFFILSLLGNASYGAGILCHSLSKEYLLTNLPWLIGSLGTMAEDVIIFVQFHMYVKGPKLYDTSAVE